MEKTIEGENSLLFYIGKEVTSFYKTTKSLFKGKCFRGKLKCNKQGLFGKHGILADKEDTFV